MAALDWIEVEGYKSIRSAKIELGAINVLIGANGAGKSNLLSLFGLLADLADSRLQLHITREGGADAILHFGRKKTQALHISLHFGRHGYDAALIPSSGDTLVFEHEIPSSWESPLDVSENMRGRPMAEYAGAAGRKETGLGETDPVLGDERFVAKPLVVAMRSWRQFHFHDTGKSTPAKQKRKIDDNRSLHPEGDTMAPFLFALKTVAS